MSEDLSFLLNDPEVLSALSLANAEALQGNPVSALPGAPMYADIAKALMPMPTSAQVPSGAGGDSGALKSFFSALIPEALGLDPLEGVEEFRADNPAKGKITEFFGALTGYAVGAGAALKGATLLPRLGPKLTNTLAGLVAPAAASGVLPSVTSSFARGAVATTLATAPFETVRIANAAAFGEDGRARDVFTQALVNLGVGGLIGGGVHAFASGRPQRIVAKRGEEKLAEFVDKWNLSDASQVKLMRLNVLKNTPAYSTQFTQGQREVVDDLTEQLLKEIETEWGTVKPLGKEGAHKDLNRLFAKVQGEAAATGAFTTHKLRDSKLLTDLPDIGERMAQWLPERWQEYAQFPTVVRARSKEGASKVYSSVSKGLTNVGEGWWLGREAGENGLFVMGRKLKGGAAQNDGDVWMLFKTNNPRVFAKESTAGLRNLEATSWALKEAPAVEGKELRGKVKNPTTNVALPGEGIGLAKEAQELFRIYLDPTKNFAGVVDEPGKLASMLPEQVRNELGVAGGTIKEILKTHLAPGEAKFSGSLTATRMRLLTRDLFDLARARVVRKVVGTLPSKGTSALGALRTKPQGGIIPLVKEVYQRNSDELPTIAQLNAAVTSGMSLTDAAAHKFDGSVLKLLQKLRELRVDTDRDILLAREVYGATDLATLSDEYYLVSRGWRGNLRLPLRRVKEDGTLGEVIDMASGHSRREVMLEAQALTDELAKDGIKVGWKKSPQAKLGVVKDYPEELLPYGPDNDYKLMMQIAHGSDGAKAARAARYRLMTKPSQPGRLTPIRLVDAKGFAGGLRPLSEQEFIDRVTQNLWETERFIAESMLKAKYLKPDLARLAPKGISSHIGDLQTEFKGEFPLMADRLQKLVNDLAGRVDTESISSKIDNVSTQLLGRPLTTLTRALNKATFHLTFGALDFGFPALNAMTFIQTGMPETVFLAKAPTKELSKYYGTSLIMSSHGPVPFSHLDPLRIAKEAFNDMRKASLTPELWKDVKWAIERNVVSPRYVEEFVGEVADQTSLRALRNGDVDLAEWLSAVNKWPAARSEEFTRLHSFLMGRRIARDFRGLTGEEANLVAKRFVERTMFNYGVADRAAIMTGPIGNLWGLFKNWPAHYMWNMMQYSKVAMKTGDVGPLLWALGGTGLLGGATAVPGYFAFDALARAIGDKDFVSAVYEGMGAEGDSRGLDAIMYGVPAFLGVSLSSRAAAPFSDPARDVNTLFSIASIDRIKAFGEFTGAAADTFWATGQGPGQSKQVFDKFMKAVAPRTIYRAQQMTLDGALRSLNTTNQLFGDMNFIEQFAYLVGVAPIELQKAFDVQAELWRRQESRKLLMQTLGEEGGEALEKGDVATYANLMRRAFALGLDPDSFHQSAQNNYHNRNEDLLVRQFKDYQDLKTRQAVLGR